MTKERGGRLPIIGVVGLLVLTGLAHTIARKTNGNILSSSPPDYMVAHRTNTFAEQYVDKYVYSMTRLAM